MVPQPHDAAGAPLPPRSAPVSADGESLADLKRKSVKGGVVTLASEGFKIVVQLASTIVLARLLTPEEYGIIAMVVAVTAFAALFRTLGLSSAAIQKRNLTHAQQSNLFWMNVAAGVCLTLLVAAAAPWVARFYQRPELLPVTLVLSLTFVIGSIGTQHGAILARRMAFGRKALAANAGSLATLCVASVLAVLGHSYWALVWGNVAGSVCTTLLLVVLSPLRPSLPAKGTGVREMLRFGAHVTAFDLVNYFHRNLDNILIGRFWGGEMLGLYSRAYGLLMLPISSIRGPINSVAFPALSKLQDNPPAFRKYYLRTTSLLALLSMPLTAFLVVAARPVVELALGDRWLGVVPIFSVLAIAAFIQPASGFAGSLLLSLGRGRRYLACGAFNAAAFVVAFGIGVRWGALGVAVGYTIANYAVLYPWLRWTFKETPVSFRDFAGACAFPALLSLAAAAVSLLVLPDPGAVHPVLAICQVAAVFAVTSAVLLLGSRFGRRQLATLMGLLPEIFPRMRSRTAEASDYAA